MKAKYINPYTNFGFKKLFGEEAGKDLLKDFLNQLLPMEHKIVELGFITVSSKDRRQVRGVPSSISIAKAKVVILLL